MASNSRVRIHIEMRGGKRMQQALAQATDKFREILEQGKTQSVSETQPQGSGNAYGSDNALEPVIAHKHTTCYLCKEEIEPGDAIVSGDGERWVHSECAVQEGWVIA